MLREYTSTFDTCPFGQVLAVFLACDEDLSPAPLMACNQAWPFAQQQSKNVKLNANTYSIASINNLVLCASTEACHELKVTRCRSLCLDIHGTKSPLLVVKPCKPCDRQYMAIRFLSIWAFGSEMVFICSVPQQHGQGADRCTQIALRDAPVHSLK